MKKIFISIIFILLTITITNSNGKENRILIKVNNEIITSYDLLIETKYLGIININYKQLNKNDSIEIAKNSLIREKIKKLELKKYIDKIEIEEKQLNQLLLNYFRKYELKTIDEFDEFFMKKNINPKIIKKKISLEILWNQFVYNKFKDKIIIDKNLIIKEIEKNNTQKEFFLYEILFNLNQGEQIETKFNKIKKEINEKGFAATALKYSISDTAKNGGQLGWVKNSVLSSEIREGLSKTSVGNFTSPIRIPAGFLILKIENFKILDKEIDLEKEVKYIIQKKTDQQLNQLSNIYLNKAKKY